MLTIYNHEDEFVVYNVSDPTEKCVFTIDPQNGTSETDNQNFHVFKNSIGREIYQNEYLNFRG